MGGRGGELRVGGQLVLSLCGNIIFEFLNMKKYLLRSVAHKFLI